MNFHACAKFHATAGILEHTRNFSAVRTSLFLFSAQNDSVSLIFLFILDVILLTWAFFIFHFFAWLYIAILCTVDLTNNWGGGGGGGGGGEGGRGEENTGALFLFSAVSLFFSIFLTFLATKHSLENDNSRNVWLNPLILEDEGY